MIRVTWWFDLSQVQYMIQVIFIQSLILAFMESYGSSQVQNTIQAKSSRGKIQFS